MNFFVGIIFIIITLIALVFSFLNFQPVTINLYFTTLTLPLALALTIELLAGISLGFFIAFKHIVKLKKQYTQINRKLNKVEKENHSVTS